jgi:hypothetical protein
MDISKLFGDLQSQLGGNQDKIKTALSSANVPQDAFSDLGKQFPEKVKGLGSTFSGAFPQQSDAISSQLTSTLQSANIQEVFSSRSGELNAFLGEGGADQIGGIFNNVQDLDIQGKFDLANERFADINFGEKLGDINTNFEAGMAELSVTLSSEISMLKRCGQRLKKKLKPFLHKRTYKINLADCFKNFLSYWNNLTTN